MKWPAVLFEVFVVLEPNGRLSNHQCMGMCKSISGPCGTFITDDIDLRSYDTRQGYRGNIV